MLVRFSKTLSILKAHADSLAHHSGICTNFPYPEEDFTGSVGRPVPGVELKLVDTNDPSKDITGYGVRGEVCIRGDTVIRGYLDDKATAESWDEDGYFHTGDIAYCDEETGKWYIVDRKKELIKVYVDSNEEGGGRASTPTRIHVA